MTYLHSISFLSAMAGLILGLGSCSPEKSHPSSTGPVELKVIPPVLLRESRSDNPSLAALEQTLVVSALDTISFPGFATRSSNAPVQLRWNTNCRLGDKPLTIKNAVSWREQLQVSQLLPPELFFTPPSASSAKIHCDFSITAYQPATLARHDFGFSSQVTVPATTPTALRLLFAGRASERQVLPLELSTTDFGDLEILSDRATEFHLHCDSFVSTLEHHNRGFTVSSPVWISPQIRSPNPHLEDPLQRCRLLGLRDGFITTWSAYFELKEKVEGPSYTWESSTAPIVYRSRREFPSVSVGTLSLHNPHPYPQLVRLTRSISVELIPFCFPFVKAENLNRTAVAQLQNFGEVEILNEVTDALFVRLGSGGRLQATYSFAGQIECHCPDSSAPSIDRRRIPSPVGDHEAGYFFRLTSTPPLVELLDWQNGHPDRGLAIVVPPMVSGFRWAGNLPPRFTIPLRVEESMIATRPVTPGLCK